MSKLLTSAAIVLVAASAAFADTITVETVNLKDSAGEYIGPYGGKFNGSLTSVYCDDLLHNIQISANTTNVVVSTVADLSNTRFGGASAPTASVALADYEEIFYLSTFLTGTYTAPSTYYSPFSGGSTSANTNVKADIQDAMWSIFDSAAANNNTNQVNYWLTLAQNNYSHYSYSNYRILTDSANQYNGVQELFVNISGGNTLVGTPEPGTVASVLGGMAALAFGWRRKRARV